VPKTGPAAPSTYLVEAYWPGLTESDLTLTAHRAERAAEQLTRQGTEISYRSAFLMAQDEVAFCLFEARSQAVVEEVCRRAGLPFDRILAVLPIQPLTNPTRDAGTVSSGFHHPVPAGVRERVQAQGDEAQ